MDISFKISGITLGNAEQQVKLDDVEFKVEKVSQDDIKSFLDTIPQFIHHLAGSIEDFSETIAYSKELLEGAGLEELLAGLKEQFEGVNTAPIQEGNINANATKADSLNQNLSREEADALVSEIFGQLFGEKPADEEKNPFFKGFEQPSPFGLPKLSPEDEALFYKLFGKK